MYKLCKILKLCDCLEMVLFMLKVASKYSFHFCSNIRSFARRWR